MFSPGHIVWIAALAAVCAGMFLLYEKVPDKKKMRRVTAFAILLFELYGAIGMMLAGSYNIYTLPLHLCGMAVYLIVIHALTFSDRLGQFLYAFCFPGSAFAVVFPDWYYYPLWNIQTVLSFVIHILICAYIVMQVRDIRPDIKKAPSSLLFMMLLAVPVYIFDRLTDTNYMFLNWPVEPLTLFENWGRPGYLLGFIPVIAVTWAVIYLPFMMKRKNTKEK